MLTATNIVFRARGLSKVYVMGEVLVHAPRDADLDICEREFVVLLGPSGSGKSTLLNILGGLDAASGPTHYGSAHTTVGNVVLENSPVVLHHYYVVACP